jgi:hypothetical protein
MKPVLCRAGIVWLMMLGSPCLAGDNGTRLAAQPNSPVLDYIVGRWEVDATDPTTGQTEKIGYEVQRFVGSAWVSGTAKSTDPGFAAKDVWGRDPLTGEVIRIVFDSSGTYATVKSPGWKEDGTLVLEGDARSAKGIVRVRETIRRISADEFHATWEAQRDGHWRAYSVERAKRSAPLRSVVSP